MLGQLESSGPRFPLNFRFRLPAAAREPAGEARPQSRGGVDPSRVGMGWASYTNSESGRSAVVAAAEMKGDRAADRAEEQGDEVGAQQSHVHT